MKLKLRWMLLLPALSLMLPTYGFSDTCADCHSDLMEGRIVHVPVEEEDCGICHDQKKKGHPDKKGDEFKLVNDDLGELCGDCHDLASGEGIHSPVSDGMCESCHDPHRSSVPKMLIGKTGYHLLAFAYKNE